MIGYKRYCKCQGHDSVRSKIIVVVIAVVSDGIVFHSPMIHPGINANELYNKEVRG